ncbi:uncharacterized protein E0L32_009141 [Thyridium curvatum]|uniref:Uncharacterized protein n=1 Tax=Thyridium curvatum TaxID=1093900 RepID=A0A507AXX9_9PEZI|nr:uncharacterized protein E0L32_009141 [Thyridium curvatum]TPX09668.1 hypothetical protein E0L32_009141 [Thyridium curvatum]
MTYRAHLPPGQAYNGQQPMQHQQHGYPAYGNGSQQTHMPYQNAGYLPHQQQLPQQHQHLQHQQQQHQQQQQQQQQHMPPQTHPQFHMSAQQRALHAQQQAVPNHNLQPQQLYSSWDGSYLGHGVPMPSPVPAPSELQFPPRQQYQPHPTTQGFQPYQQSHQPSPQLAPQPSPQLAPQPSPQLAPQPSPQPAPRPSPQPAASPILPQQMPPPPQRPSQERSAQHTPLVHSPIVDQGRRLASEGSVKSTSGKQSRKSSSSSIGKSPKPAATSLVDAAALLVCTANDCFSQAQVAVEQVAAAMDGAMLQEYHKLIATGLACLEAALNTNKLQPRAEAKVRLRYGATLNEETENLMQAETALSKGITVCEKHRFADLKLYTQYHFLRVLFRRNRKAALIAVDKHISDCTTYKQVYWIYAFRFLKAAFYVQGGSQADAHALENLRSITILAGERGDNAICVLGYLLEGLTLLKTMKDDAIVRIQTCIAQASKYQLDATVHIPQLDILTLLLDLACSLHQKVPSDVMKKLTALQSRMDDLVHVPSWKEHTTELLLPMRKQGTSSQTISGDTGDILRPGDGDCDFLVLSSFSKMEVYVLAYTISGLGLLYKPTGSSEKSLEFWNEAQRMLPSCTKVVPPSPSSLPDAIDRARWRKEMECYIHIMIGLHSATHSDWARVKSSVHVVEKLLKHQRDTSLETMAMYLSGIYQQGVGELDSALRLFEHQRFSLIEDGTHATRKTEKDLSILAALNRLCILQAPSQARGNEGKTDELIEQLTQICPDHPDPEIKTAFNLVMATVETNPPMSINQAKRHIHLGLKGAQTANNTHCLSIALNIMRFKLFENVVGEQALKSAKAGATQAKKSGNLLWMSVADGMLAQSYEVQGALSEAREAQQSATRYANEAFEKTHIPDEYLPMLQLGASGARIVRPSYICTSCRVAATQSTSSPKPWTTPASCRSYATEDSTSKKPKGGENKAKEGKTQPRRSTRRNKTRAGHPASGSKVQLKIWQETLDVLKNLQQAGGLPGIPATTSKPAEVEELRRDGASPTAAPGSAKRATKHTKPPKGQVEASGKQPLDQGSSKRQIEVLTGALELLKDVLSSQKPPSEKPSSGKSSTPKAKRSPAKKDTTPAHESNVITPARPIAKQDTDATSDLPQASTDEAVPHEQDDAVTAAKKKTKTRSKKAASPTAPSAAPTVVASNPLRSRFKVQKVNSNNLKLTPVPSPQPPVPRLQYGLDRALFNPGVYHLQDPRSRVYNFDPYLATIMPIHEFDFKALKEYITSSKDNTLISIAAEHKKKYTGSTSSMTSTLAHFHYLLSAWRPINPAHTSRSFEPESYNFTNIMRAPSAAFLHWKDGTYAIDADKEYDSANILSMLGKSMEKLLTLPKEDFEKYRISKSHELSDEEKNAEEAYHYTTLGDFMMRSQLDAHDPRVLGSGMFDLKTRAVVSIRMDAKDFHKGLGYEIRNRIGQWESFEREYYDMIRSAFLKYSLQVRMGRMDGIFVAFHNTQRIFGFQYISINEMDLALHGTDDRSLGDREFKLSLHLLNQVLDRATAKYPGRSLRLHIETRPSVDSPFMYIFAKPVTTEEISEIQNANKAEIEAFEQNLMGLAPQVENDVSEEADPSPESEEVVEPEVEEDDLQSQDVWEEIRLKVEEATENEALGVTLVRETIEDALEHSGLLVARSPEETNYYVDALLEAVTSPDTAIAAENIHNNSIDGDEGVVEDNEETEREMAPAETSETGAEASQPASSASDEVAGDTATSPAEAAEENLTAIEDKASEDETVASAKENIEEVIARASSKASATKLSLKDLILKLAAQVEASPQDKTGEGEDEKWTLDTQTDSPKNKRFERILSQLMATSKVDSAEGSSAAVEETSDKAADEEGVTTAEEPAASTTDEQPSETDTAAATSSSSSASAPAPAEEEQPKKEEELLGMILTIRNKVNGAYVQRPEGLTKGSSWVVEYAIEELEAGRAALLYERIKARRRQHLGPDRKPAGGGNNNNNNGKPAWDRVFMRKLQDFSRRGVQFRRRENAAARSKPVLVYGLDRPLEWDDVFKNEPKAPFPLQVNDPSKAPARIRFWSPKTWPGTS